LEQNFLDKSVRNTKFGCRCSSIGTNEEKIIRSRSLNRSCLSERSLGREGVGAGLMKRWAQENKE